MPLTALMPTERRVQNTTPAPQPRVYNVQSLSVVVLLIDRKAPFIPEWVFVC